MRAPTVLFPGLLAVVGLLFLLPGFGLRDLVGRPYLGDGLITAGLLLGAPAVGAAVGDLIWLRVTRARRLCETADETPDETPGKTADGTSAERPGSPATTPEDVLQDTPGDACEGTPQGPPEA
ncbi:hypothetical protein ACYF6T_30900 [Streptomyces sp. 7R007]